MKLNRLLLVPYKEILGFEAKGKGRFPYPLFPYPFFFALRRDSLGYASLQAKLQDRQVLQPKNRLGEV